MGAELKLKWSLTKVDWLVGRFTGHTPMADGSWRKVVANYVR